MRYAFAIPVAAILLSSCTMKSDLNADEVLLRSMQANREVTSARFTFDMNMNGDSDTAIEAKGVMQNGGSQLEMSLQASGESSAASAWSVDSDIVVAGEGEVYVKLNSFDGEGAENAAAIIGKWWMLPSQADPNLSADITPDPKMFRMQTETIDVVEDNGIVSIDGHKAHHYDVRLNKEKLAAFLASIDATDSSAAILTDLQNLDVTGEIWIDAESFVLRKAEWKVRPLNDEEGREVDLSLSITDHNSGITVSPPAASQPLPIESLFPLLPFTTPQLP